MIRGSRFLFITTLFAVGLPFLPLLLWAVSDRWFFPALIPQDFGLRSFHYIFGTAANQILTSLASSFKLSLTTTLVSLVLGVPAGRALGLYSFRLRKGVSVLLMLPVIVPPLAVSMGLHLWFIKLGLDETFGGLVLVHLTFCLPYAIFVLQGVFSDYTPDFEAQARSLGAGPTAVFLRVTLPLIMPGLGVAALFCFLLSWSQYLSTLIIGGGKILTLPILLFALMDSGDRPVAAAVSLIFILPALLALLCSSSSLGRSTLRGIR